MSGKGKKEAQIGCEPSCHNELQCLDLSRNAPPLLPLLVVLTHTCFLGVALSTKMRFCVVFHDMRCSDVLSYHIAFSKIAVIPLAKEGKDLLNAIYNVYIINIIYII